MSALRKDDCPLEASAPKIRSPFAGKDRRGTGRKPVRDHFIEWGKVAAAIGLFMGLLMNPEKVGCDPPWPTNEDLNAATSTMQDQINQMSLASDKEHSRIYRLIQENQKQIADQGRDILQTQRSILRELRHSRR